MDTLTIPRMVFQRVARKGDTLGFRYRRNGIWQDLTWTQYGRAIKEVALALDGLGLKPGDRSAILCNTRIEWHFADLGTLSLGALAVGIYPTLLPEDVAYILKDSGSRVLFVEDWHQLEKVRSIWDECKDLEYVLSLIHI